MLPEQRAREAALRQVTINDYWGTVNARTVEEEKE